MALDRIVAIGKAIIRPEIDGKALNATLSSLEDKTKAIGKSVSNVGGSLTKSVTLPIVGAGAAAMAAAGTVDDAMRTIRVGTGATGDTLDQLKDDFEAVAKTSSVPLTRVADIVADLNTRLGLTGQPMQELAGQVADLEQILGGDAINLDTLTRVFGAFQVAPEEYSNTLDKMFRASQATGVGVNDLQNLVVSQSAAFGELGFSLDETIATIGQFEKAGVNTETVIAALKQNIVKAAKEGKTASEFFRDGVAEIEGYLAAGDDAAAQAKASELFGARTFLDALDAIKRGEFDISGTLDQIENGGDTISGLSEETKGFGAQLGEFKNQSTLALAPLGQSLFPILTQAVEQLLPPVIALLDKFTNASPGMQKLILTVGGIAAAIGPVLLIVGKLITTVGTVIKVVKLLGSALTLLSANPVGLIIMAIAAVVAGLIYAYQNFEGFRNVVDTVIRAIGQVISTVWENVIKPVWDAIWWAIENLLIPYFQTLWKVYSTIFKAIGEVLKFVWDSVIKPIWDLIAWYIENILIRYYTFLWNVVKTVWNGITDAISTAWGFISGIFDAIKAGIAAVADWIGDKINTVVGFFTGLKDKITGAVKGVWDGFTRGAKTAFNWIANLWNSTVGKIKFDIPDWVPGVGGKTFGMPTISPFEGAPPALAAGGVITKPTLAMVGETAKATPEIVTPERLMRSVFEDVLAANANSGAGITNIFQTRELSAAELADEVSFRQSRQLTGRPR